MNEIKKKLCPRCKVFPLDNNPAMNSLSHDGKIMLCSTCGQIESLETFDPLRAWGLKQGIRQAQAALYGLDEYGVPKLPKDEEERIKEGLKTLKTEECKPFVPVEDNELEEDWAIWENEEDNIRKSKRKSIRNQGKYKSRGKEKRREP